MDTEDHVPMDIVPKLGEMGIMGVFVPEEYGGAGLGHIERCIALEEIARYSAGLAMMVFTHHLGVAAIVDYGTEAAYADWLSRNPAAEAMLQVSRRSRCWKTTHGPSTGESASSPTHTVRALPW